MEDGNIKGSTGFRLIEIVEGEQDDAPPVKIDGRRFNRGRPKNEAKVNTVYVRLSDEEIEELDRFVKVAFNTRSGILRRALHFFLQAQMEEAGL